MATVFDTAKYILEQKSEMTVMKLQKLVYYSQAWNIVWNENELFSEQIEAWANGPVTIELYKNHKGLFRVTESSITLGNSSNLEGHEKEAIDKVLSFYGDKSAQWLSDLTHMENPWKDARVRAHAEEGANCQEVITPSEIEEYYTGL